MAEDHQVQAALALARRARSPQDLLSLAPAKAPANPRNEVDPAVGIIGPGRAGVGLALALARAGYTVRLHGRRKKAVPKPLELTVGPADVAPPPAWLSQAGGVILAVRDDAIPPLAGAPARGGGGRPAPVGLPLSGGPGHEALGSL